MTTVLVVLVVGVLLYLVVKFVPMHPVIRAILVAPLPRARCSSSASPWSSSSAARWSSSSWATTRRPPA